MSTLVLDGMRVPVEHGGHSRRARLTVDRDGSLRLRAAEDVSREELEQFLAGKRDWIYTKLAEKEVLQQQVVQKELVNGEGFLYLGRNYQLRVVESSAESARLINGRLILPKHRLHEGRELILDWYRSRGRSWLRRRVSDYQRRLRVTPHQVEVRDVGTKWGVASAARGVHIHWATMQLHPDLIDYVLVHELAHLHEPHHGPTFWTLVRRVMPDCDERKAALAAQGAKLWFGEIAEREASRGRV